MIKFPRAATAAPPSPARFLQGLSADRTGVWKEKLWGESPLSSQPSVTPQDRGKPTPTSLPPPCQWCSAYWWGLSSRGSTRQGPQGKPPGLQDLGEGACSFIYNSL